MSRVFGHEKHDRPLARGDSHQSEAKVALKSFPRLAGG